MSNPDSPFAELSAGRITACYWELEEPEKVKAFVQEFQADKKYAVLHSRLDMLLVPYYLFHKQYSGLG